MFKIFPNIKFKIFPSHIANMTEYHCVDFLSQAKQIL